MGIFEGNKKTRWKDRVPYAYWKGNLRLQKIGKSLSNASLINRIGMLEYTFRYKIYIEGCAWSVSQKFIFACDSVCLVVTPHYYDLSRRGLLSMKHYWPIQEDEKCRSIKLAVDWGNIHEQKVHVIGEATTKFIRKDLHMDYAYGYMFHVLNKYAKLLRQSNFVQNNGGLSCRKIREEVYDLGHW